MTPSAVTLDGSVVVIGSTMIDMSTYCDRFPKDGETLVASAFVRGFGGKGANQAVAAALVGGDVTFVGRVGADKAGEETVDHLQEYGIDTTWLRTTPGMVTGVAPIWIDRSGVNRILIAPGANTALSIQDVDEALTQLEMPRVILAQLETPQPATISGFARARRAGVTTVLNPAPAAVIHPELLEMSDWLLPNETEFETLWGKLPTVETVMAAAEAWSCGLAVTVGERGAILAFEGAGAEVPSPATTAVDTSGAGDAFAGTFAVALASNQPPLVAAELGCRAGSLSVAGTGTQTSFPTAEELFSVIDAHQSMLGKEQ